jgi:hypothetical protein
VNPACEILIEKDWLCGRYGGTEGPRRCFSLEEKENLVAFNLFSGQLSLGDIGRRLAGEMGWDEARGFAHAKGVFLSLASQGICTPRDPPDAWD